MKNKVGEQELIDQIYAELQKVLDYIPLIEEEIDKVMANKGDDEKCGKMIDEISFLSTDFILFCKGNASLTVEFKGYQNAKEEIGRALEILTRRLIGLYNYRRHND